MNPKDMTNYDLVSKGLWATFSNGVNDGRGRKRSAEHTELTDVLDVELLRRLDERDQYKSQWENCNSDYHFAVEQANALRKENEELKEKVYFFARTFRYYADEAFRFYEKHPLARETDETRAANTAKESEAIHE